MSLDERIVGPNAEDDIWIAEGQHSGEGSEGPRKIEVTTEEINAGRELINEFPDSAYMLQAELYNSLFRARKDGGENVSFYATPVPGSAATNPDRPIYYIWAKSYESFGQLIITGKPELFADVINKPETQH